MPRQPTGNPTGRPPKEIDWDQFEKLCALQCTQSEIASVLHIHSNTLSDRVAIEYGEDYSTTYKKYSECGKCSLRRNQFVLSKTNASMAIWLGKIWLGQKDPDTPEIKDVFEGVRQAIREAKDEGRTRDSGRSFVENKSSVLHQECRGEKTAIHSELGTKDPMGGDACV